MHLYHSWFSCVISLLIGFSFSLFFVAAVFLTRDVDVDGASTLPACSSFHPWNFYLERRLSLAAVRPDAIDICIVTLSGLESMLALFLPSHPSLSFPFLYPPSAHFIPPPSAHFNNWTRPPLHFNVDAPFLVLYHVHGTHLPITETKCTNTFFFISLFVFESKANLKAKARVSIYPFYLLALALSASYRYQ
ncbi:hypothetical protein CY34DRAFT_550042 [Suillus luteus UH-Slu-Lm8-n1]|uniref:Unplaced genomic scaffold CY34scaffold_442, whole genome shotgun sequence n=1 Tax=Suillus luteus UH-Slu-Lm8-n1 TaxID=930992 RepID=A0A0D0ANU6_9AGAM|nr:hypothetical protein CY34DRAFT_550042 [Suillus luteus UH-Slu-Lm8-n1]